MAVNIYNPSPSGGVRINVGSQVRQFSDNFTRANSSNLGIQWASATIFNSSINANVIPSINANLLRFSGPAANTGGILMTPVPLAWMTQVPQLTQFAQATLTAQSAATYAYAVAVLMSPANYVGSAGVGWYEINYDPPTGNLQIFKAIFSGLSGTQPTFTAIGAVFGPTSLGHSIRLSAQNNGSGTWTLTGSVDGVVLRTVTDNSLTFGQPGLFIEETGAMTLDFSNFSGGVGI